MGLPYRKRNRLPEYDYSTPGAYFITMCTQEMRPVLSSIVGDGALDGPYARLTKIGHTVERYILSGNNIPRITVDKYVIMPNHVHMILLIDGIVPPVTSDGTSRAPSPTNDLIPHFVSTLKRFCHRDNGAKIFQRSYHDHVIRNEKDYQRIWQYIDNNPARWREDCFFSPPGL